MRAIVAFIDMISPCNNSRIEDSDFEVRFLCKLRYLYMAAGPDATAN